ncbi:hypothetical protein SPBR_07803 [Sporothrix brasiliensis 5110]|uniref:4-amino-5-hydroxymethyl-2-methylpyrimidine phosphate synthase n=1 Tax=Sporothrix brasiliensis 5110 TaxID=1398154 RepID=A0A0C2IP72_9PEZI|nr:uncharacterized protein SPBR_07803 [Sporothrix brasiliensis 5110]KIH88720.1 hypothetical protein SPBR_07803 [Sporothrix brasiliensis 5110]
MAATAAPTRFHIAATGHSLNYLPQYIAERHGYFRDEGLAISVSVPSPWDNMLEELGDGTAAAALGGIWVPSMYRSAGKQYTAFAQLSNRCPLALVARGGVVDKTVLLKSGNGASVGLFFKMLLREHGLDPAADLAGPMLHALFEGGLGDYFVLDIVSARILAQTNADVHVVLEMAADGDAIPWSVYYCETETLGDEAVVDAQTRFCTALERGMRHRGRCG